MLRFLSGLVFGCAAITLAGWAYLYGVSDDRSQQEVLVARLLSPELENPHGAVTAEPFKNVEFLYEIQNTSATPVSGIRTQLFCQCAVGEDLPETLAPGQTVHFGITFKAPAVGIRRETLTISSEKRGATLLTLTPAIRANLTPPKIVSIPKRITLNIVKGEESVRDVLVGTVESADS